MLGGNSRQSAKSQGFTLVELVVVIVVLGILSIGTVQFIRNASDGYAQTARRSELGSSARLGLERMVRELRYALPNSVRVNASCIESIPVLAASDYLTIPVGLSSATLSIAPLGVLAPLGARVAVFPDASTTVYNLGDPAIISPPVTFDPPDGDNVVEVNLNAAHRFPAESPEKRLYVVGEPISFCIDGDRLWRYQGYGFAGTQPTSTLLPGSLPGRALVADSLSSPGLPFEVADATLTRNAVVSIDLEFRAQSDRLRINRQVQLRNVP